MTTNRDSEIKDMDIEILQHLSRVQILDEEMIWLLVKDRYPITILELQDRLDWLSQHGYISTLVYKRQ